MQIKSILALALAALLAGGAAQAQTPAPAGPGATNRTPISGDPGTKPLPRRRPNAKALSRADKQPPGTENGNQPDRASAGGGSR